MHTTIPILFADDLPLLLGSLLLYFLFTVVPLIGLAWLIYYLLSLPMRRQERARFFLDLVATALREGRPIEQTIIDISNTGDTSPGLRFHLISAYLERGLRLGEALEKVPRFLPPQVTAMFRAGEAMGDIRKVLPVCDYLVKDAQSNVRGAISYLVVVAFGLSPISLIVLNTLAVLVLPKFNETAISMDVSSRSFTFLKGTIGWLMLAQAILFALLLIGVIFYIGGPRFVRWVQFATGPVADWLAWRVPWKRRRMQRNFSMILAIMLDNGVPESDALRLAGESVTNEIFRERIARAQKSLAAGAKLTEAVASLDDTGEFRWRLTNAIHAHGGFLRALTGWHESLDAKAFQQEQAAAHTVTSGLVIANGLIVATVAIGVFSVLISIINEGLLW
jgi:type II secretory pathway component PulF